MANAIFNAPHFHDEAAAFAHVEKILWPNGPFCLHCGNANGERIVALKGIRTKASKKNPEGAVRHGLYRCKDCRGQFTVRLGTIFEETHLALHLWLQVIHMMGASKKGISTRQVQRLLNCSMQTAWHLTHRIREIMKPGSASNVPPLGGVGTTVEADETYSVPLCSLDKLDATHRNWPPLAKSQTKSDAACSVWPLASAAFRTSVGRYQFLKSSADSAVSAIPRPLAG